MNRKIKMPKIVVVLLVIVILIVGLIIWYNIYKKVTVKGVINDDVRLAKVIEDNASKYKTDITFYTAVDPGSFNYDEMFHYILSKNTYIGCELYAYYYTYTYEPNGLYKVNLKLREPAIHKVILTRWRVKQIASHLRKLEPYDQVKAVHDYLVLSNEYSYTMAGAYNALYVGKSSCNGYAYSFYAIMQELGVPVTCEFGGNHAWNRVCLDGLWYNIDVTWDDVGGSHADYTYFLKCDADWEGHEHGGATASKSHEITGKGDRANYNMIPNYRLLTIIFVVGFVVVIYIVIRIIKKIRDNREFNIMYGNIKPRKK